MACRSCAGEGSPRVTFDDQLELMLAALPRRHRIPFEAGVRFAAGFEEHGESLFRKSALELARDERQELADRYTYRRRRLWLRRHRSE